METPNSIVYFVKPVNVVTTLRAPDALANCRNPGVSYIIVSVSVVIEKPVFNADKIVPPRSIR
jgi:hypothetical protein